MEIEGSENEDDDNEDEIDEDDDEEDDEEDEDEEDEDKEDDHEDSDVLWDITGEWELKCPKMDRRFVDFVEPPSHSLSIYCIKTGYGKQLCGRFDLGYYQGVIRFSTRKPRSGRQPCNAHEFLFGASSGPCGETPTISYRWRGREVEEDVIQLRSETQLYTMTFSRGGRRVRGTWGVGDADSGDVTFTGRKVASRPYRSMYLQHSWDYYSEQAYDRARRRR